MKLYLGSEGHLCVKKGVNTLQCQFEYDMCKNECSCKMSVNPKNIHVKTKKIILNILFESNED